MSKSAPPGADDTEVVALLKRYDCPTPFHEVRTRFLGTIASPIQNASPMQAVEQLWGGTLPAFDTLEDLNDLLNTLVAGLWNRLTAHQDRRRPFQLVRLEVAPTREELTHFALVRRQELDGFTEGLFGSHEHLDLPQRAHKAIGVLGDVRAMLAGAVDLLKDPSKPAVTNELKALIHNLEQLTAVAETELNEAILSCHRARSQALKQVHSTKPILH